MADPRTPFALFSTSFLPYSQTFIHDEICAHRRYVGDVFCKERLNAERFPYPSERIHTPGGARAQWLYETMGTWHGFHRTFEQQRFSLIHAHFGTGAVYAVPYARKHKLPLVVTFWGNDVSALIGSQRHEFRRWRYVLRASSIFRQADLMLAVSRDLQELVADLSGRPDDVKLYHHGTDLTRYQVREDTDKNEVPHVVFVGRFTEKKGMPYGIRAFAEAIRQGRRAHLTLAGGGEQEPWLRQFVKEQNLEPHVTFAGILSQSGVAALLARADVVLVPSVVARDHDREGSPTVIREASASGVPILGTYHGGIPEAVADGETGFLVNERDVPALAERLITLLDDAGLRRQMGRAGREKMEREYDVVKQVAELEDHYDRVRL